MTKTIYLINIYDFLNRENMSNYKLFIA